MNLIHHSIGAYDVSVVVKGNEEASILHREMAMIMIYSVMDSSSRVVNVYFDDVCSDRVRGLCVDIEDAELEVEGNGKPGGPLVGEERRNKVKEVVQECMEHYRKREKEKGEKEKEGVIIGESKYACIGGTFDHIHYGHKVVEILFEVFLGVGALITKKLLVGVTQDFMLAKKKYSEFLEPLPKRLNNVESYLRDFKKDLQVELFPLTDGLGPSQNGFLHSFRLRFYYRIRRNSCWWEKSKREKERRRSERAECHSSQPPAAKRDDR